MSNISRRRSRSKSDTMDKISPERRSANMRAIRSKNTSPEMLVRRLVHRMGYRYRLHRRDLPGAPDLVFPGRRSVVFVHGCFWHLHPDVACADSRVPESNQDYWRPKLERNRERDRENTQRLEETGWRVLVIWACETGDEPSLKKKLGRFLGPR